VLPMNEMRSHLTEKILPFWESLLDSVNGGFCGFVGHDLGRDWLASKGCILNSRILWTFSTAARVLKDDSLLVYARQALRFLEKFIDREHGGVIWSVTFDGRPLDTTKHTYNQAFAIYALSAYARATGDQQALDIAMTIFHLIEDRCTDSGGYGEAFNQDFSPEDNEKLSENGVLAARTMNTLLHIVEAYAELYRAAHDEQVQTCGTRALELIRKKMFNREAARLDVFFDSDYHSLIDMQSYGHDIEASWLLWDAAETFLTQDEQLPIRSLCLTLADSVLTRAMTDMGLLNECVRGINNGMRIWWVQAEAVLGFSNAYRIGGAGDYRLAAQNIWKYIKKVMVDPRPGGEWFWSVFETGVPSESPVVEPWKCPYHNSRMCLRILEQDMEIVERS